MAQPSFSGNFIVLAMGASAVLAFQVPPSEVRCITNKKQGISTFFPSLLASILLTWLSQVLRKFHRATSCHHGFEHSTHLPSFEEYSSIGGPSYPLALHEHIANLPPLLDEHENSSKENPNREPGCIYMIGY
jgi:hypothetical protein